MRARQCALTHALARPRLCPRTPTHAHTPACKSAPALARAPIEASAAPTRERTPATRPCPCARERSRTDVGARVRASQPHSNARARLHSDTR
eukprot:2014574-Pleurochrysis_carterae.AAC.1